MPHHFKTMRKWIKAAWLWMRIVGRVDQTGMRMGWLTACEVCRIVHLD